LPPGPFTCADDPSEGAVRGGVALVLLPRGGAGGVVEPGQAPGGLDRVGGLAVVVVLGPARPGVTGRGCGVGDVVAFPVRGDDLHTAPPLRLRGLVGWWAAEVAQPRCLLVDGALAERAGSFLQ